MIRWRSIEKSQRKSQKEKKIIIGRTKLNVRDTWDIVECSNIYVEHGLETEFVDIMSEIFTKWWKLAMHKFKKIKTFYAKETQRKTSSRHTPNHIAQIKDNEKANH